MISPDWFVWYGLNVGLTYDQALDIPFGELSSLIAIEQIKREGAKRKIILSEQEAFDFWGGED